MQCHRMPETFQRHYSQSCAYSDEKRGVHGGKYLLNTPENAISESLNFKMSLDASALKNLCLWCEFQSRLLFITSLLLKNFLTALYDLGTTVVLQYGSTTHTL